MHLCYVTRASYLIRYLLPPHKVILMSSPSKQKAKGTWKVFQGKLQEAWGALSGDDLDRFEGRREQLEGHIQRETGEKRERIRERIDEIAKKVKYQF